MPINAQQQAAQRNLSYLLAEKIAQQLLSGHYKEGSILPGEMELAGIYSVSRTAVREAIKILAAKGMVLPRPRIGTRVMQQTNWNFLDQELLAWWMNRENSNEVMQHFLIMRTSLEPQACFLAATQATPEQKHQLSLYMGEMRALDETFDRERWIAVDGQFHQLIYEASANPFLTSFANLFSSVYHRYFQTITGNEVIKLHHHHAIVSAILASDGPAARSACLALLTDAG
jgi:DNA-binding FadR family transcriptional regulator